MLCRNTWIRVHVLYFFIPFCRLSSLINLLLPWQTVSWWLQWCITYLCQEGLEVHQKWRQDWTKPLQLEKGGDTCRMPIVVHGALKGRCTRKNIERQCLRYKQNKNLGQTSQQNIPVQINLTNENAVLFSKSNNFAQGISFFNDIIFPINVFLACSSQMVFIRH